jgi:hypothetical protein
MAGEVKEVRNCPLAHITTRTVINIRVPLSAVNDAFFLVIMRTTSAAIVSPVSSTLNTRSGLNDASHAFSPRRRRICRHFTIKTPTKWQHILLALEIKSKQILPTISVDPKGCFFSFKSTPTPFFSVHYASDPKTFPPSAVCTFSDPRLMNLLANLELPACFYACCVM